MSGRLKKNNSINEKEAENEPEKEAHSPSLQRGGGNQQTVETKAVKKGRKSLRAAKRVAVAAVCTALLSGGKMALAAIPNVEVVTLLCAVYGYSLGILGIVSVIAFVLIEILIWGFGTWVFSYILYWPFVCAYFMLLRQITKSRRALPTVLAFLLTVYFSLLTSFVDVTLFTYFENFFERFWIYYARGVPFYIAQIVTNLVLFPTLFPVLTKIVDKQLKLRVQQ